MMMNMRWTFLLTRKAHHTTYLKLSRVKNHHRYRNNQLKLLRLEQKYQILALFRRKSLIKVLLLIKILMIYLELLITTSHIWGDHQKCLLRQLYKLTKQTANSTLREKMHMKSFLKCWCFHSK